MAPRTIMQLVRYGQGDEILKILDREVPTRKHFLDCMGSSLCQFIGLAASKGCIELLEHCKRRYGVKLEMGTEEGLHVIVGAASQGHDHVINWLLEPWISAGRVIDGKRHSKKNQLPQDWLQPALHKAIQGQHVSTVRLLVDRAWAKVNGRDFEKLRPIHVAARPVDKNNQGEMLLYEAIINILVLAKAEVNYPNPLTGTTPLYDAISLGSREATKRLLDGGADVLKPCTETETTVLHIAAGAGYKKTLHTLIDHKKLSNKVPCDFDVKDKNGRTPLHAAVYGGHLECARVLMNKGLSLSSATKDEVTVATALFEQVPNSVTFLTEILDEKVTTTDKSGNTIDLDFGLMASKHSHDHEHRFPDMDVVVALIDGAQNMEQMAILQHPLLETFLYLKCLPAMPYDVFISAMYIIFAGVLSMQVTHMESVVKFHSVWSYIPTFHVGLALLIENIRRTYILRRRMDLDKLNVYLLYVSCVFSAVSFIIGGTMLMDSKKYPYDSPTRIYLRSIAILCSWVNVMLSLIRFPLIGEYFFMFFAVLKNIGKVLLSFACLIIGFAVSFSILFVDGNRFDGPWKAFTKTLVMMTGEYEYEAIFSSSDQINSKRDNSTFNNSTINNSTVPEKSEGPLPVGSIIIFLIFVIVCSITLMNLMLGLAVNDIQELLKQGRTRQLMKLANSTAVAESFLHFTKKCSRKMTLNLRDFSIRYFLVPSDVRNALKKLALKNLNRGQRPQTEWRRDKTQKRLADLQSTLKKMALKLQRENYQIEKPQTDRRRDKTQRRLAAMQSLLIDIKSSLEKMAPKLQQENCQTERPQTKLRRDNTQKRLNAMQSSLVDMQSLLKKMALKKQQGNSHIERSETESRRDEIRERLAAMQSLISDMQFLLQKMVLKKQLKNSQIERSDSPRNNADEILTAIRSSVAAMESSHAAMQSSHAAMQSTLQRIIVGQQLQNNQIEWLTQHSKTKRQHGQRRSI